MIGVVHAEYQDSTKTSIHIVYDEWIHEEVFVHNPSDIVEFLNRHFGFDGSIQERLVAFYIDSQGVIKNVQLVSVGSAVGSLVSPRDILISALLTGSTGILVAHCHPAGNSSPSKEDMSFTKDMKHAAKACGLKLIDHLILGNRNYYSFYEKGIIK